MRMVKVHNANYWLPMSIVAVSLNFVVGQLVQAAPSEQTLPVHGRNIEINQQPVISGTGNIGGTLRLSSFPTTSDPDGDKLSGWVYSWLVGGEAVTNAVQIAADGSVTPYIPVQENVGKSAVLRLQAVAESRGFPESTRTSMEKLSNPITIIKPVAPPAATNVLTSGWVGYSTRNGTFTIDGEPVTVTTVTASTISEIAVRNPWIQSERCGVSTYINAVSADHYGASTLKLHFSRPVTNIQFTPGYMDSNERLTVTTNAASAPVLTLFNNGSCTLPIMSGSNITGNGNNYGYIVNVGGEYFTELTISSSGSWMHMHYNYLNGKLIK